MHNPSIPADHRLIVALDYPTWEQAAELVDKLDNVTFFKVGLEMFLSSRGEAVTELRRRNKKIFLDLKFHDIPNTVAQACRQIAHLGVDICNVHALGGSKMMAQAEAALTQQATELNINRPALIAVTILTSMAEDDLDQVGLETQPAANVTRLAKLTREAGLDGVVASPQEISLIRQACGEEFLIICPGVRPQGAALGDQKRVMTPGAAIKLGADYLVVGRPITQAPNPAEAAAAILKEINTALTEAAQSSI
jgi:orotidine-5'-phosphate decarboxylase